MGTAIWLVPSARDAERLNAVMCAPTEKNDTQGSSDSYPRFSPHITLASFPSSLTISLPTIRAAIPTFSSSLTVEFKSIEVGTHFFRSVYLKMIPTLDLSILHEQIHEKLGVDVHTPEFPHLSLAYITDEDARNGERDRFLRSLADSERIRREGGERVSLNCGEIGKEDWIAGFQATEVWIADCDGPVERWTVLDRCPIIGPL